MDSAGRAYAEKLAQVTEYLKKSMEKHIAEMEAAGHKVTRVKMPAGTENGSFVAPAIIELDSTTELTREVFHHEVISLVAACNYRCGLWLQSVFHRVEQSLVTTVWVMLINLYIHS